MAKDVILFLDTGIDDATALLLALADKKINIKTQKLPRLNDDAAFCAFMSLRFIILCSGSSYVT